MPSSKKPSPKKDRRVERGRSFERLAAKYFAEAGYTILEHNWHAGHKEIDLIVRKDNLIVFVEVKSASSTRFGHPAERVDQTKRMRLTSAAEQYLIAKDITECDLRFDVVTFLEGRLEHFPNAFPAE
jgi:putative endonuclease